MEGGLVQGVGSKQYEVTPANGLRMSVAKRIQSWLSAGYWVLRGAEDEGAA